MRRAWLWAVFVWLPASPALGAEPGKLVEEFWEVAHVDGARVGSVHTTVHAVEAKRLRAAAVMDLTFRRHGAALRLRVEQGTEETPEGKVVGVFMRQQPERGRPLVLAGALDGGKMHVKVDGGRIERKLPWGDDVVGLHKLERLFAARKPKAGDSFTLRRYEPTLNAVVTVRVAVKGAEKVLVNGARKELLRADLVPDKLVVPGHSVQPPKAVWWLDADFVPVRRQLELDGLGAVVLTRTTKELAQAPGTVAARAPDIGLKTLVPLDRTIPRPYATRSAVYKVTVRGDDEPETALARDGHQEVRNVKGSTFELVVHPVRPDTGKAGAAKAADEYLASCHFIDSADAGVKALARKAAGGEKDPWKKALRIERWVKASLRVDNAAAMAPASQVAKSLRGDCRSYALLTAALCRAEGVPARTALGLIYVERARRPLLGFHMWTEVYVGGRWVGLDATLGRGGVGATHLKIADHSWHDTASLAPLLPVARVLGKLQVEVVRVEAGE